MWGTFSNPLVSATNFRVKFTAYDQWIFVGDWLFFTVGGWHANWFVAPPQVGTCSTWPLSDLSAYKISRLQKEKSNGISFDRDPGPNLPLIEQGLLSTLAAVA